LPDGIFHTKNPTFDIFFGKALEWKILVFLLWTFGLFDKHLVYFVVFLVYFPSFGILQREKSGKPDANPIIAGVQQQYTKLAFRTVAAKSLPARIVLFRRRFGSNFGQFFFSFIIPTYMEAWQTLTWK
jgi:hypothetical protein